ncbi:hypothetical protein TthHC11_20330 (plasmid) [Thermus thermophilus]|nr:hypothetical protein TthHC11_20330 [Thermus thermophilus]
MGYQSRATLLQVQGIAGVREATGGWDFTVIFKEEGTVWSVGRTITASSATAPMWIGTPSFSWRLRSGAPL